jgi:hypothetical protein
MSRFMTAVLICVYHSGGAVAKADSSRFPTAAALNVRFLVDEAPVEQVFPEYLGFLCHSFHRLLRTHHHQSFGAGTIGQTVANVSI